MPRREILKIEPTLPVEEKHVPEIEREISPEKIEALPDWEEPGSFYRGVTAEKALTAIFGKLELASNREGSMVGSRDNVTLNEADAIYFAKPSVTKKGRKFLCSIGFDPIQGAIIEKSRLGRATFFRFSGPLEVKEITIRFAGKEQGKPGIIRHFSPRGFYEWYKENIV